MTHSISSAVAERLSPVACAAAKAQGKRVSVLTAYDYPGARLLEEAGVEWILVGDSLGMVVLAYPDTTHVTLADMAHHTAAAARGLTHTPLIADLPIGTYNDEATAIQSARILLSAGAHAVKLEGGVSHAKQVAALTAAGIPVMGHIGMLPQSVLLEGGYRIKGRTEDAATALVKDALALEAAGAFAMVVELVEPGAAQRIREAVRIPTIGIGSGEACDGHVLVTHDLVGAFPWFHPKFVTPAAHVGESIREAVKNWVQQFV